VVGDGLVALARDHLDEGRDRGVLDRCDRVPPGPLVCADDRLPCGPVRDDPCANLIQIRLDRLDVAPVALASTVGLELQQVII
jgi:hypothetical protein